VAGNEIDALLRFPSCGRTGPGCEQPEATRDTVPRSPFMKLRTSSRNFPFHSFQLSRRSCPPGTGRRVPGLGDQLGAGQDRIGFDVQRTGDWPGVPVFVPG